MCRGVESAVQAVAVWGEFGAVIGGIAIWAGAFGCGLAVDAVGEYCWRRVRAGVSVWWVGGEIVTHFGLNLLHFGLFTYPMLA